MGRQSASVSSKSILPPLDAVLWRAVVKELKLSEQQARVVALVLQTKGDKEIRDELGIALGTVRTHIERIYARLGVHDRLQLAVKVLLLALKLQARE